MNNKLSRRDFLKISGLNAASLAFRSLYNGHSELDSGDIVRVAIRSVSVYSEPWDESRILYQRYRDELINVYYEVISQHGPGYNPIWYRVWRGFVHSAHVQTVKYQLNSILSEFPKNGRLAEVTVPISQAMRYNVYNGWELVYRLYFQSVHWIFGVEEGPDGQAWYRVRDELLDIEYLAPAIHFRPILAEELTPISPDVPPGKKRIEVSLAMQNLTAYEDEKVVMRTKISSGALTPPNLPPDAIPTTTPSGIFNVQVKMPSKHMGDGKLTGDLNAYELPGVPWVTFFAPHGVALHGTYWHTNYGTVMSHGCVNMRTEEAKWIYRWTTPVIKAEDWDQIGLGTRVVVH